MDEYQVLARKYRPQTFKDVVSQSPIVTTLKNSIQMNRTAHAYLFCGSRGTGKTTLARLFAKALNCPHLSPEGEPCNTCHSCKQIATSSALDVLEIDGASHRGIEDIRQISDTIGFLPAGSRYKIYLIDEVHMLTKEASNALLKRLEEPPPHVKFFFCTTEPHKMLPTILSRCQRFNLQRIPLEQIVSHLSHIAGKTGISLEKGAAEKIAALSEGSLRDALSLMDQVISLGEGSVTSRLIEEVFGIPSADTLFALNEAAKGGDVTVAFSIAAQCFASGKNLSYFLEELTTHFRSLLLWSHGLGEASHPLAKRYKETAATYLPVELIQILELLIEGERKIKSAPSERTALEMLLINIVRIHQDLSLESLVSRLLALEQRISARPEHAPVLPSSPPPLTPSSLPQPIEPPPSPRIDISRKEQSLFDTIMHFTAKTLNGTFKKE